jgi:hypothetical protein
VARSTVCFVEVLKLAEQWRAFRRQDGGDGATDDDNSSEFIHYLVERDLDARTLTEEQWRGVGDALGLDRVQVETFVEDAASWAD